MKREQQRENDESPVIDWLTTNEQYKNSAIFIWADEREEEEREKQEEIDT